MAIMSNESINYNEKKNASILMNPTTQKIISSGRVDINVLMNRVRSRKEQENKINLVFFGLVSALLLIVGTILSI
tara:strand:+ start:454 stop:678 length:225 start_codon:yes stop_codon:yes gene_type:complete